MDVFGEENSLNPIYKTPDTHRNKSLSLSKKKIKKKPRLFVNKLDFKLLELIKMNIIMGNKSN